MVRSVSVCDAKAFSKIIHNRHHHHWLTGCLFRRAIKANLYAIWQTVFDGNGPVQDTLFVDFFLLQILTALFGISTFLYFFPNRKCRQELKLEWVYGCELSGTVHNKYLRIQSHQQKCLEKIWSMFKNKKSTRWRRSNIVIVERISHLFLVFPCSL